MSKVFDEPLESKRILREICILMQSNSKYIVELLDILEPDNHFNFDTIYLVMSLSDSDMKKLLKSTY